MINMFSYLSLIYARLFLINYIDTFFSMFVHDTHEQSTVDLCAYSEQLLTTKAMPIDRADGSI